MKQRILPDGKQIIREDTIGRWRVKGDGDKHNLQVCVDKLANKFEK